MEPRYPSREEIQCLIYQAKTARNHYEIEDCLDLIDEMRKVMERIVTAKEVTGSISSMHKKRGDEMHTVYGEWQPIETARKNRKGVLGWFPTCQCVFDMVWGDLEDAWVPFGGSHGFDSYCGQPTHWMPLPEPPE